MKHRRIARCLSVFAAIGMLLVGCGPQDAGQHQISGKVTYNGQPVPTGTVKFLPDSKSGGKGPPSLALIANGQYSTPEGKSLGDGSYDIQVIGYDGKPTTVEGEELPDGTPLFPPYYTTATISGETGELNFEIPLAESPVEED